MIVSRSRPLLGPGDDLGPVPVVGVDVGVRLAGEWRVSVAGVVHVREVGRSLPRQRGDVLARAADE